MPRTPTHSAAPAALQASDQARPCRPRFTTALSMVAPMKA
jgi:hypothetical protein